MKNDIIQCLDKYHAIFQSLNEKLFELEDGILELLDPDNELNLYISPLLNGEFMIECENGDKCFFIQDIRDIIKKDGRLTREHFYRTLL